MHAHTHTTHSYSCVFQDSDKYTVSSETRSQLRVLETIDRVVSKRKQERENEQTLKAAKSRSKGTDPEKVARLREEAKQVSTWGRAVCDLNHHSFFTLLHRSNKTRPPRFSMKQPT